MGLFTEVISMIKQKNGADFALMDTADIKGAPKRCDNLADRDAISSKVREEGMLVWVVDSDGSGTPAEYRLRDGVLNANWVKTETPMINVEVNKIGAISVNTDFPNLADVSNKDLYVIQADVTDNAGSPHTNTGISFVAGSEIVWFDGAWVCLGVNYSDAANITYDNPTFPALTSVKKALDSLLYLPISVTSISISEGYKFEKGSVVDDVTINWTLNKATITQQSLTDADPAPVPSARSYAFTGLGLVSNKTWTLAVDDGQEDTARNMHLYFLNRAYYGSAALTDGAVVTETFIKSLPGLDWDNDSAKRKVDYLNGANEYMWYAYPARLGDVTPVVGGFTGGFYLYDTIEIENASGYTETYKVYRSSNVISGTVEVSFN